MGTDFLRALSRVVALTLIAIAFWFLGKYHYAKPALLGPDAPAIEFSAAVPKRRWRACLALKSRIRFQAMRTRMSARAS
ncbi:MAG: hypothetical protein WDM89_20940 [Rhizomicrobium sp.]